jgi:hypothetical protein
MKAKMFLVLALVLMPCLAFGAPFVICDYVPTTQTQPTYYHLVKDGGVTEDSTAQVQADNSVRLHYDLAIVTTGAHSWTVSACNEWGCSSTVPFAFSKAVPSGPANLRLSNQ